jgi:hypothetical protein
MKPYAGVMFWISLFLFWVNFVLFCIGTTLRSHSIQTVAVYSMGLFAVSIVSNWLMAPKK